MLKIVILDAQAANPGDLSWSEIEKFGELTIYESSSYHQIIPRVKEADVIITNKGKIDKEIIDACESLRCILLLATGYNNIDTVAAEEKNIAVYNAVGYSSPSVAQHVMACMLHHYNRLSDQFKDVSQGGWNKSRGWTYKLHEISELNEKKLGIYGFGKIGSTVAHIGAAFGMKILAHHKRPIDQKSITSVDLDELFETADVITLHASLSDQNHQVVNNKLLAKMKATSILINTGRGGLIDELALFQALNKGKPAAAYLDVLSEEPPATNHQLIGHPRCYITPHQAWASLESRKRLISSVANNLEDFINGRYTNRVV